MVHWDTCVLVFMWMLLWVRNITADQVNCQDHAHHRGIAWGRWTWPRLQTAQIPIRSGIFAMPQHPGQNRGPTLHPPRAKGSTASVPVPGSMRTPSELLTGRSCSSRVRGGFCCGLYFPPYYILYTFHFGRETKIPACMNNIQLYIPKSATNLCYVTF